MKIITGATLVKPDGSTSQETLILEGNKILDVTKTPPASLLLNREDIEIFSGEGCYLTPGLIDQHFHGGFGCCFNHSSITEINGLLQKLPMYGITSTVPTVMTAPQMDMVTAGNTLEQVIHLNKPGQCRVIGIHMEGPFLNPAYRGAHPESELLAASLDDLQGLLSPNVRIVTMAPELDPQCDMIRQMVVQGVRVSAGHSAATYEEMTRGVDAGISCVTHLYNAMRPFHHREPGIIGSALNEDRLYAEIIGDGIHVNPEAIRMAIRSKKPEHLLLISDCLALAGLGDGASITFGNQPVTLRDGQALNAEGHLAGSAVFLNECVKNLTRWNVSSFAQAIRFATANPATFLGVGHQVGKLEPGYLADMVLWDAQTFEVYTTWIDGEVVYSKIPSLTR